MRQIARAFSQSQIPLRDPRSIFLSAGTSEWEARILNGDSKYIIFHRKIVSINKRLVELAVRKKIDLSIRQKIYDRRKE